MDIIIKINRSKKITYSSSPLEIFLIYKVISNITSITTPELRFCVYEFNALIRSRKSAMKHSTMFYLSYHLFFISCHQLENFKLRVLNSSEAGWA